MEYIGLIMPRNCRGEQMLRKLAELEPAVVISCSEAFDDIHVILFGNDKKDLITF